MKLYIKDMLKITGQKYQDILTVIYAEDGAFNTAGGPNASVPMDLAQKVARRFGISLVEEENQIIIHRNVDDDKTTYVGNELHQETPIVSKEQLALNEYNLFEAEEVDPLRIKADINQVTLSTDTILKFLEKDRIGKKRTILKTVLNDGLIHDYGYLQSLFKNYGFLVAPTNLSKRIREKLGPMFLHVYITDAFTNKLVAFNNKEILYCFIVNV